MEDGGWRMETPSTLETPALGLKFKIARLRRRAHKKRGAKSERTNVRRDGLNVPLGTGGHGRGTSSPTPSRGFIQGGDPAAIGLGPLLAGGGQRKGEHTGRSVPLGLEWGARKERATDT